MKKYVPRTLNYGCLAFSVIGILPSLILMVSLLIIAQEKALTPNHYVLLLHCSLSVGLVAALIMAMRNGKRWSMLITVTLLMLSLLSVLLQAYTNYSNTHSTALLITFFCLSINLLALALILTPSSQHFFSKHHHPIRLALFLKALGLVSLYKPK